MNLEKGFSDRTVAAGKNSFSLRRTNLLKETINWAQEFRSISRTSSLIGISNTAEFRAEIEEARKRARISKLSLEESSSLSKAVNPGNLKRHKDCIIWSRALKNYLSTIIGQEGVSLIYVIRECAPPDSAIELQLRIVVH